MPGPARHPSQPDSFRRPGHRGHPGGGAPRPVRRLLLPAALVAGLLAAPAAVLGDETRDVYLPELRVGESDLAGEVGDVQAAAAAKEEARLPALLEDLLERAGDPQLASKLVRLPRELPLAPPDPDATSLDVGTRFLGLRAFAMAQVAALSSTARAALTRLQEQQAKTALASERPPGPALLVARFPLAKEAGRAALRLWSRAVEAEDTARCDSLAAFLRATHPALADGPEGRALGAVSRALSGDARGARAELRALSRLPAPRGEAAAAARRAVVDRTRRAVSRLLRATVAPRRPSQQTPPVGARLVVSATRALPTPGRGQVDADHSPSFPTLLGGRVCVSNGACLGLFDLDGTPLGEIPQDPRAVSLPPSPATGFQGRITAWDGVGFTPLVLERWLVPARLKPGQGDPSFAGRFYSLVAFDPARARILWWDGDPGPTRGDPIERGGVPPGQEHTPTARRALLRRCQVLACVAGPSRVYAAITVKAEEPELRILAYTRSAGDQPLVLRPAWGRATYLLSAERPGLRSAEDEAVMPEVAASLALERDRLVVTTDLGVTAGLDAGTGRLLWVRQTRAPRPTPRRASMFVPGEQPAAHDLPSEPARFARHKTCGRVALFYDARAVAAARVRDGRLVWLAPRLGANRLLVDGQRVLVYGGPRVETLDPQGRVRLGEVTLRSGECVGRAIRIGDSYLFPTRGEARQLFVERYDVADGSWLRLQGVWPIGALAQPANLLATPHGIVAASASAVAFLRWEKKKD